MKMPWYIGRLECRKDWQGNQQIVFIPSKLMIAYWKTLAFFQVAWEIIRGRRWI